jgi:hypothetical protein
LAAKAGFKKSLLGEKGDERTWKKFSRSPLGNKVKKRIFLEIEFVNPRIRTCSLSLLPQSATTQDDLAQLRDRVEGPAVKHPVTIRAHDGQLADPNAMFFLQLRKRDAVMTFSKASPESPINFSEIEFTDLAKQVSVSRQDCVLFPPDGFRAPLLSPMKSKQLSTLGIIFVRFGYLGCGFQFGLGKLSALRSNFPRTAFGLLFSRQRFNVVDRLRGHAISAKISNWFPSMMSCQRMRFVAQISCALPYGAAAPGAGI